MEINIARKIDYWIGIPLCFLISLAAKIKKMINPGTISYKPPKSIMFIEFSEMGSAILAYPAIKEAKKAYPDAEIYFWTFEKNAEALKLLGIIPVKNILTARSDSLIRLFRDTIGNLLRTRRENIEAVVDLELFSRFSSILSYLTGAKSRIGFYKYTLEGLYRGNLHTHKVQYKPYIHISRNFCNLIRSFSSAADDLPLLKKRSLNTNFDLPKINITEENEKIRQDLRKENKEINLEHKIVIINPGLDDRLCIRRWPLGNYVKLIEELTKDPKIFVILAGIESGSPGKALNLNNCINLIGKTSIKKLITLFNISDALVSNDGGMVHLASLTKIKIIALFGPETPLLYAPLSENAEIIYKDLSCSPCLSAYNHRQSVCKNNKCMKEISVEEVYALTRKACNE